MINPQTQSHLYGFDGNEMRSLGSFSLPVRTEPYNVITEFYVVDVAIHPQRDSRKTLASYYEARSVHLSATGAVLHFDWDG